MTKLKPSLFVPSADATAWSILRRLSGNDVTCFGHPIHALMFSFQWLLSVFPDSIAIGWLSQTALYGAVVTRMIRHMNSPQ